MRCTLLCGIAATEPLPKSFSFRHSLPRVSTVSPLSWLSFSHSPSPLFQTRGKHIPHIVHRQTPPLTLPLLCSTYTCVDHALDTMWFISVVCVYQARSTSSIRWNMYHRLPLLDPIPDELVGYWRFASAENVTTAIHGALGLAATEIVGGDVEWYNAGPYIVGTFL